MERAQLRRVRHGELRVVLRARAELLVLRRARPPQPVALVMAQAGQDLRSRIRSTDQKYKHVLRIYTRCKRRDRGASTYRHDEQR